MHTHTHTHTHTQSVGAGDKIMMLADGNAQFTKAIGVDLDLTDKGLGIRSRRYAMLVDDQVRCDTMHHNIARLSVLDCH